VLLRRSRGLRRVIVRIVAIGFWVMPAVGLATTYLGIGIRVNYPALWAIAAACLVGGSLTWFVRWDLMDPRNFLYVLVAAIGLVTLAVHYSGGRESHLLALFVLPAVVAGALYDIRVALLIAAATSVAIGLPLVRDWDPVYAQRWVMLSGVAVFAGYIPARVRLALDAESAGLRAEEVTRRQAEEALKKTQDRLRTVVANAPIVVWAVDLAGKFIVYEGKAVAALGQRAAALGMSIYDRYRDRPDLLAYHRRAIAGEEVSAPVEFAGVLFDAHFAPLRNEAGAISGMIGVSIDVSDRERARRALEHRAHHDPLTGLPNGSWLREYLEKTIASQEITDKGLSLLIINLNQFGEVNDAFGNAFADALLQQIAGGLRETADTVGGRLARLEGDEFAIVAAGGDRAAAIRLAEHLLSSLQRSFLVNSQPVSVTARLGISLYPEHSTDAQNLLRRAHVAMASARQHDSEYAIYMPADDQGAAVRLALVSELRQAIDRDELILHYQPQANFRRGQVTGVESLVRWVHPHRGMIPPADFIVLAERSGLIKGLSEWVVRRALRESRGWLESQPGVHVSVNLSMRNLVDPGLPAMIARLLEETHARAEWLRLEITESVLMADPPRAMANMHRLRDMGVAFAVDDFGTGYSSLRYLGQLPIREIKIDRSFVSLLATDVSSRTIVRATIELGHNLGFETVAEGVEDRQSWDLLSAFNCDAAQGYYIARPLPASELSDWLRANDSIFDAGMKAA